MKKREYAKKPRKARPRPTEDVSQPRGYRNAEAIKRDLDELEEEVDGALRQEGETEP